MSISRRLLLAIVTLLLATAGRPAEAQEGPSLVVDPAAQTVALEDGPFDVRITVDDVTTDQGLGGYTLVMDYDPTVLRALTITDSGFVGSTENAVLCPASAIDNDAGRLAHFCFTIPIFVEPGPQTSEPQVLAAIRFEPVAEGTTTIDIGGSTIADPQGNGLGATTTNGQVTVREPSAGPGPAGPQPATPAGSGATDTTDAATGGSALPVSGTAMAGEANRTGFYVTSALIGIGGTVALVAALVGRMRRRTF